MLKFVIIGVSSIIIGLIIILLLIKYIGKEDAINHYLKIVKNNKFLEIENRITSAVTTFEKVTLLFCIQFFLIMLIVNLIARVVPDLSDCNNTINNILIFIITEDTASSALLIAFINYTKKYYVCFDYNEIVKKHHIKSSNIVMLSETFIVSLCYAVSLMINYSELQCLLYCISISALRIAISNRGSCCIDYFFETIIKYKQNNNNIYYNIAYNLCTYFSYKHFNDKEYIYKIATKETNAFNDNIFNIGQSIVFEIEREDPNLYKHMQDELFQYRFKNLLNVKA